MNKIKCYICKGNTFGEYVCHKHYVDTDIKRLYLKTQLDTLKKENIELKTKLLIKK